MSHDCDHCQCFYDGDECCECGLYLDEVEDYQDEYAEDEDYAWDDSTDDDGSDESSDE